MKQIENKHIDLKVLTYKDGKYHVKFPNLDVPIVIDEDIYKKWIVQEQTKTSDN